MKNIPLKSIFTLVIVITILLLGACKKDDISTDGFASLRIVNTYEGSSAQDFYQDDSKLASGIVYGGADAKVMANIGNHTLKFTNANNVQANASIAVSLYLNTSVLVFYHKKADGSGEVLGYQSSIAEVPAGKAYVRFINLGSLLSSPIDVTAGTDKLTSGLTLKSATDYTIINSGTALSFGVTGSLTMSTIPVSEFKAGKIYTVWFNSTTATTANYHVVTEN